jgi:hypothetical protein
MLATGTEPTPPYVAVRRYAMALGWGLPLSFVLMLATIGLLADLKAALTLSGFWVKISFAVSLAAASLMSTLCLSRPGAKCGHASSALILPIAALWVLALVTLIQADVDQRVALLMGKTWVVCPGLIAMLSLPIFVPTLWAMRGLAPTHLRLAGGSAGLFAGAVGAFVYTLHCPEMDAPFIAVWYLLGILIPAAVGVLIGRSVLRW